MDKKIQTKEEIKQEWAETQRLANEAAQSLLNHSHDLMEALMRAVCNLCDVTPKDLMGHNVSLSASQSRWLLWYAYRQATGDTFARIAEMTKTSDKKFTANGVGKGVRTMMVMTDTEPVWHTRWLTLRHIIKSREEASKEASISANYPPCRLVLNVPRGMKEKIKIEIKENK